MRGGLVLEYTVLTRVLKLNCESTNDLNRRIGGMHQQPRKQPVAEV